MLRAFVSACVTLLAAILLAQAPPARLKAGDVVRIVVFGSEDLTGDATVQSDGALYAPSIGRVVVAGKTLAEVQDLVLRRLKRTLRDPHVDVLLKDERKVVVYVLGGKLTEGAVPYTPQSDLRQVLAEVQLPGDPDLITVSIFRKGALFKTVNAARLVQGDPVEWNGPLLPDDVIVINQTSVVRVWVTGLVRNPGEIKLREGDDVYRAIAAAGGLDATLTSALGDVQVAIRRGPNTITIPASPVANTTPVKIQSGDTIVVSTPGQIRVSVIGEVTRQGEVTVRAGQPATAAVAAAGGITSTGSLETVYVVRNGNLIAAPGLDDAGQPTAQGPALESGDIVLVRKNEREFFVFGQVRQPGQKFMDEGRVNRLTDALGKAGGTTDNGTLRRVVLLRRDGNGTYEKSSYNLDEFLKDGKTAANPELRRGDFVFFGTPKGVSLNTLVTVASSYLLFQSIFRR